MPDREKRAPLIPRNPLIPRDPPPAAGKAGEGPWPEAAGIASARGLDPDDVQFHADVFHLGPDGNRLAACRAAALCLAPDAGGSRYRCGSVRTGETIVAPAEPDLTDARVGPPGEVDRPAQEVVGDEPPPPPPVAAVVVGDDVFAAPAPPVQAGGADAAAAAGPASSPAPAVTPARATPLVDRDQVVADVAALRAAARSGRRAQAVTAGAPPAPAPARARGGGRQSVALDEIARVFGPPVRRRTGPERARWLVAVAARADGPGEVADGSAEAVWRRLSGEQRRALLEVVLYPPDADRVRGQIESAAARRAAPDQVPVPDPARVEAGLAAARREWPPSWVRTFELAVLRARDVAGAVVAGADAAVPLPGGDDTGAERCGTAALALLAELWLHVVAPGSRDLVEAMLGAADRVESSVVWEAEPGSVEAVRRSAGVLAAHRVFGHRLPWPVGDPAVRNRWCDAVVVVALLGGYWAVRETMPLRVDVHGWPGAPVRLVAFERARAAVEASGVVVADEALLERVVGVAVEAGGEAEARGDDTGAVRRPGAGGWW